MVTCTYRGILGELARPKLQEALHGKDLVEALALVQGLEIPAWTEPDAPPIIIAGYDHEHRMLFVQLVGRGCYAYVHRPPVCGGEVWEEVVLSFLKGIPYNYGALSRFTAKATCFACSSRVRGLVRTYWLVRQFVLLANLPPLRRPVPTAEDLKKRTGKGRKGKKGTSPSPATTPPLIQLPLF